MDRMLQGKIYASLRMIAPSLATTMRKEIEKLAEEVKKSSEQECKCEINDVVEDMINSYVEEGLTAKSTVNDIIIDSWRTSEDKGWHDSNRSFGDQIALIHSELSEALEEYRAGYDPKKMYIGDDGKPEGIPAELADVIIRIGDMCGVYNIDLSYALIQKSKYNTSRPYRHGNKVL